MMRRLLKLAICFALTATLAAEEKFIAAPAPAAGLGRYRVAIASERVEDLDSFVAQLPAICRCRLELYAEDGFHGVMIRASAAAAKMLSADPRVARVEEMASDVTVPEVVAEPKISAPPAPVSVDLRPSTEANATPWDSGLYAYDGAGNIKSIGAKKYTYDTLGRLKSGGESTAGHRQQYTYDRNGNVLTIETYKPQTTTLVRTMTVDAGNHVSTFAQTGLPSTTAQYDAAGRLKKFPGGEVVAYDAGDMVVESKVGSVRAVHLYTASDERLATIGITDTNVRQGSDWTIRDLSGKVLRRFKQPTATAQWLWDEDSIYRDGQLLAAEVATQEHTLHFHPDHLGTPRLITGNGGAEVAVRDFHPFGEEITVPDPERMTFTGHERDSESLDYMHARYYAMQWGRFLSVDPTWDSADLGKPQTWNRYTYVTNNPVNLTDPDGKCPTCIDVVLDLLSGDTGPFEKGYDPAVSDNPPRSQAEFDQRVRDGRAVRIEADRPYQRPSGATTPQQRASVQNKPCEVCGKDDGGKRVAGHKKALVQEHYETGTIDKKKMRSLDAVRPECPTCSAKEGAAMSRYSRAKKEALEFLKKLLL